jgi:hypothetical protein
MPALIVEWSVVATWRTMSRTSLTIAHTSAQMAMILTNVTSSDSIERPTYQQIKAAVKDGTWYAEIVRAGEALYRQ